MATNPADLPNYVHPSLAAVLPDLELQADLLAGTRRMHETSTQYIRKWTEEDDGVYLIRRQCETLFGGFTRTLSAAVGMIFAKPPTMTWNASEAAFAALWPNIDAAGTAGQVFAKRFAEQAVRDGLGLIMVDHPPAPADTVVTAANEQDLGLRPYWARYERRHILAWRVGRIANRQTLTMVTLAETAAVEDGTFGVRTVQRYRVLRLLPTGASWSLYEATKATPERAEDFALVGSGMFRNRAGQVAHQLPVAIAYTGRTDAPLTAALPLLDVAWANLAHWQIATNLRFNRDVCGFEQLTVSGELMPSTNAQGIAVPGKLKIGPLVGVHVKENGSVDWKGPTGTGLAQLEAGKKEKLQEMAVAGVAFLSPDTRAAETAEAKRLDATAQNSTLATAAQGIEDALNAALEITAWYAGIAKADAPVIALNRDYEAVGPDAPLLTAFAALVKAGFPKMPVLEALQRMGVIGGDADLEALASEWEASEAAAADAAALSSVLPQPVAA